MNGRWPRWSGWDEVTTAESWTEAEFLADVKLWPTRLRFSTRFRNELRREYEFLQSINPAAARSVVERILKASLRLREFPRSGRSWRLEGAWELVVPGIPYVVIYDITEVDVILRPFSHISRCSACPMNF